MLQPRSRKQQQQQPATLAASRKLEVGIYLGHLPRPLPVVPLHVPTVACVACALLSAQQAGAAAARGVAVAYAEAVV